MANFSENEANNEMQLEKGLDLACAFWGNQMYSVCFSRQGHQPYCSQRGQDCTTTTACGTIHFDRTVFYRGKTTGLDTNAPWHVYKCRIQLFPFFTSKIVGLKFRLMIRSAGLENYARCINLKLGCVIGYIGQGSCPWWGYSFEALTRGIIPTHVAK